MGYLFVLLAVSMAVSALGWIYFIYFFSVGYGFSIAALAVALAVIFADVISALVHTNAQPCQICRSKRGRFHAGGTFNRHAQNIRLEGKHQVIGRSAAVYG